MKFRSLSAAIAACVLALAVAGCGSDGAAPSAQQAEPQTAGLQVPVASDQHADHGPPPVLAEGQRWQTDAPLRQAMTGIRADVASNLPAYHESRLQAADAEALALAVEGNVNYMIANCKLAPEPDAVLHGMIGRMMGAVSALRKNPASDDGVPQLVSVVNDYQATFDHEGIQPLLHD